jgi:hypothetical protein
VSKFSVITDQSIRPIDVKDLPTAKAWVEAHVKPSSPKYTTRWHSAEPSRHFWQIFNTKGRLISGAQLRLDHHPLPKHLA